MYKRQTLKNAVQLRRAALKDGDRTCGYPSIVNLARIAEGDLHLQTALAAMFTVKYGSIIVMEKMTYAEALPLYGLRQNIYTDPQKPMKVEPGIYPCLLYTSMAASAVRVRDPLCVQIGVAVERFVFHGF